MGLEWGTGYGMGMGYGIGMRYGMGMGDGMGRDGMEMRGKRRTGRGTMGHEEAFPGRGPSPQAGRGGAGRCGAGWS